jgi:3-oxoacyl-ACP reductase-like protein
MREPKSRTRLLSYAKLHRDQAQLLAEMAGISQTANDPRRIAYALPFQLSAEEPVATNKEIATITRSVEKDLAADYLTLVASVAPADRALLYDAALAAARRAQTLGASFDELFPLITGGDAIHALQSDSE